MEENTKTPADEPAPALPLPATPAEKSANEGTSWAMACHLAALAGFVGVPFGHLLGPLVVWLLKRDDHPEVADAGREALNFQLTVLLASLASGLLICCLVGIPLLVAIQFFNLVMIVVASVRASGGEAFRYPLTIRFLR